jgi:hypothetical protein
LLVLSATINSTFLSEQTSHQQPVGSTFLSEQTSTSHQPPAKRTGRQLVKIEVHEKKSIFVRRKHVCL